VRVGSLRICSAFFLIVFVRKLHLPWQNPKGDRVKFTMSGKFLPYKYYGNEQGIPDYGFKES
jgi:hypothetical protein